MTGHHKRELLLMTSVFDDLTDEQFKREWVPELLDQLCNPEEPYLSLGQLAKALTDVRTRYEMMMRGQDEQRRLLNDAQERIVCRLRGVVSQKDLAQVFRTSQPNISFIQRRRK